MNTPAGGVTLPEVKAAIAEADSRWTAFIRQPYDATAGLDLAAKNAEAYASHLALAYCRVALAVAGGWLPIESANRDVAMWVCYRVNAAGKQVVEFLSAEDNIYDWSPDRGTRIDGVSIPTHWMPYLPPEPPTLATKEPGR